MPCDGYKGSLRRTWWCGYLLELTQYVPTPLRVNLIEAAPAPPCVFTIAAKARCPDQLRHAAGRSDSPHLHRVKLHDSSRSPAFMRRARPAGKVALATWQLEHSLSNQPVLWHRFDR